MAFLTDLWLPILVAAVVVFIASFLAWMVLPHHRADIKKLPDEAGFIKCLGQLNIPAGLYMWPNCESQEEMKNDEFKERYARGPWGNIRVLDAQPSMGRNLVLAFIFYLVVGVFVAYVTYEARSAGAAFGPVFQVAGAVGVASYCLAGIPHALWFGKPTRFIVTDLADGIVYGLLTGAAFALLWPSAA